MWAGFMGGGEVGIGCEGSEAGGSLGPQGTVSHSMWTEFKGPLGSGKRCSWHGQQESIIIRVLGCCSKEFGLYFEIIRR